MDRLISLECCVSIFVLIIGISVPMVYILETWYHDRGIISEHKMKLMIGIMSARENFEYRQALRSTWIKDIGAINQVSDNVEYKFVIGSKGCDIHMKNRKDIYSCERLNYFKPRKLQKDEFPFFTTEISESRGVKEEHVAFMYNLSITMRYPIIVKRLGLHLSVHLTRRPITVQIIDASTEQSVLSAKFNTVDGGIVLQDSELGINNYRFQPVHHVLLPKGFEGQLVITCDDNITLSPGLLDFTFMDNTGGTLDFEPIDGKNYPIQSEDLNYFIVPNIIGSIHEEEKFDAELRNSVILDSEHVIHEEHADEELLEEIDLYNDIIFVDVTDVYRNLPRKLLLFHKWVHSDRSVQFVLKTDDDCFLNIIEIMKSLTRGLSARKSWWGNFRENWFVERTGKWAEKHYRSTEYPAFACGSGNIVSNDISEWLASNSEDFFIYQGEDTSMGIWLSALGPSYVQDDNWSCYKDCKENVLTIPQLTVEEIQQYWNTMQTCGKLCSC
ncbi:hypothetical protein ACF0H5_009548 [Mactra antiquata]